MNLPTHAEIDALTVRLQVAREGLSEAVKQICEAEQRAEACKVLVEQLLTELKFYTSSELRHPGERCEYTDKVDEGCYLCREAENARWPQTVARIKRVEEWLEDYEKVRVP